MASRAAHRSARSALASSGIQFGFVGGGKLAPHRSQASECCSKLLALETVISKSISDATCIGHAMAAASVQRQLAAAREASQSVRGLNFGFCCWSSPLPHNKKS